MGVMVTQSAASWAEQRTSSGLTVGVLEDSLVEGALSLWNWCCPQVESVSVGLNCRSARWCGSIAWYSGENSTHQNYARILVAIIHQTHVKISLKLCDLLSNITVHSLIPVLLDFLW